MERKGNIAKYLKFLSFYFLGVNAMIESNFQKKVRKELKERYPGCYVLKNDANYIQGIPDLLVLYKDKWAMLEVKKDKATARSAMKGGSGGRPNQAIHVNRLNEMSYAAFIYPENKEDIFNELDRTFNYERNTRDISS